MASSTPEQPFTLSKDDRLVLVGGLRRLRIAHRYVDDNWYSCPKAPDGCANDAEGDECNCGADTHNALVDALIRLLGFDPNERVSDVIQTGQQIEQDRAATSADEPNDDLGRPK